MWTWIVIAAAAVYFVECLVWPETTHRMCSGTGRLHSPLTRSWRTCTCGGTGKTVRWLARLWRGAGRTFS